MKCPNCDYENQVNAKICTRCGELLISPSATNIIDTNNDQEGEPKYGSIRFMSKLVLEVVDSKARFIFEGDQLEELIIGRRDTDTGEYPSLDLSTENALELGVSRNHAVIVQRDNALHIRDNDSANGTYLNGQRLIADQFRVLRDGDDIQLGKMTLRVTFE